MSEESGTAIRYRTRPNLVKLRGWEFEEVVPWRELFGIPDEEQTMEDTQLPEGWPAMYNAAGEECDHQYHWDDSEDVYRCVYCGDTSEEPSVKVVAIDEDELTN